MKQRILLAFLFSLFIPIASAQVYKITDLGPLSPTAINFWGQVVGNSSGQAFIWTQFTGPKGLGTLPGGTFSNAAAINDLGDVAGTADGLGTVEGDPQINLPNQECSDLIQPFVWTPKNGMQGLGTVVWFYWVPYSCFISFSGTGTNVRGQVVGYTQPAATYQFGFLWTSADGMTLSGGGNWPPTFINGISNTGQIVGQSSYYPQPDTQGIGHATSWKKGVATDLGTLGGGADVADYGSSADGVNDLGQIVGWSTTGPVLCCGGEGSPVHAVLWTSSGGISDLGTLPGDTSSAAVKTNLFGQVIGSSGSTLYYWNEFPNAPFEVVGRPFLWTQRSGMQDLNTLIRGNSGWVLNTATGINFWGQIVGSGTLNGETHGFLLTPRSF